MSSNGSSSSGRKGNGSSNKGNGHANEASQAAPPKPKTYVEGQPFPGRIGRTWNVSEPAFPVEPKPPKGSPNVLYIVLDDVGFGWSSAFGGLVDTPNITRLAEGGLKYVNFHTTALCSPTRVCLLTGRNHHSVGMANITELATGYPVALPERGGRTGHERVQGTRVVQRQNRANRRRPQARLLGGRDPAQRGLQPGDASALSARTPC